MMNFFNRNLHTALLALLLSVSHLTYADDLSSADSLFVSQKYTEALEIYEQIFTQNLATDAMLLKMSFIHEGLGNYAEALYFLNIYYLKTSDKSVATKMRELAEEYELSGYEYSDYKYIMGLSRKYKTEIIALLIGLSIVLFGYGYRRSRKHQKPAISIFWQSLVLVIMLLYSNNLLESDFGIISNDQTLMMSGPSAGSEPLEIVKKGNKVEILDHDQIWSHIIWKNKSAYIRTKNIQIL